MVCVWWSVAVQGGYDCIDLSDNALKKLDNFPDMPDLRTLLLSNNLCVPTAFTLPVLSFCYQRPGKRCL